MTCAHCHTWNFRDYRYCRHCGTKLDGSGVNGNSPGAEPESEEVERLLQQAFGELDNGDADAALATVQGALALQPVSPAAHSALGIIYDRQGKVAEAIQQLEFALQLNPDNRADREKLEALAAKPASRSTSRRSPLWIAVGVAALAGCLVFGLGLAVMRPAPNSGRQASGNGSEGTASYSTGSQGPTGITGRPMFPLRPMMVPGMLPAQPPNRPPATAAPITPAPQQSASSSGSWRGRPAPQLVPAAQSATGSAPATIGELVPLPQAPGSSPNTASAGAPGAASRLEPTSATAPGDAPQAASTMGTYTTEPNAAAMELSEPETGFIRIETGPNASGASSAPLAPTRSAAVKPAPRAVASGRPASISLSIGTTSDAVAAGAGETTGLAEARRAERRGFQAMRRRDLSEAEKQYQYAARLYEALAGGADGASSESRQAREGLEQCRKALAAFR